MTKCRYFLSVFYIIFNGQTRRVRESIEMALLEKEFLKVDNFVMFTNMIHYHMHKPVVLKAFLFIAYSKEHTFFFYSLQFPSILYRHVLSFDICFV